MGGIREESGEGLNKLIINTLIEVPIKQKDRKGEGVIGGESGKGPLREVSAEKAWNYGRDHLQ